MLRIHCCLGCADALRDGVRMDAKYCSGSCRTQACRQRKRLGIPPFPSGKAPRNTISDAQEQRPSVAASQEDRDLDERVIALSILLDAATSRNTELEVVVAQIAMRETEASAQNSLLQKELSAAQARIRELAARLDEIPSRTQTGENGVTRPMVPATGPSQRAACCLGAVPRRQESRSGEPVSTGHPPSLPTNPQKAECIRRGAQALIDEARYCLTERRDPLKKLVVSTFDHMSDSLRRGCEVILIKIDGGQNPSGSEDAQRQWALNQIRDVMQREQPAMLSVIEMPGAQRWRQILTQIAMRTLASGRQDLRRK